MKLWKGTDCSPKYSKGALGILLWAVFPPSDTEKMLNPPTPTHSANGPLRKSCSCSKGFVFASSLGCQRGERSPNENSVCLITMNDTLTDKALLWSSFCISAVTYEANENRGSHSKQAGSPETSFPLYGSWWVNALSLKVLMSWNTGGEGPSCHAQHCCWPRKEKRQYTSSLDPSFSIPNP